MQVVQVGLTISELIDQARRFGCQHGIKQRALGELANPQYASRAGDFTPSLHPRDRRGKFARKPLLGQPQRPPAASCSVRDRGRIPLPGCGPLRSLDQSESS